MSRRVVDAAGTRVDSTSNGTSTAIIRVPKCLPLLAFEICVRDGKKLVHLVTIRGFVIG